MLCEARAHAGQHPGELAGLRLDRGGVERLAAHSGGAHHSRPRRLAVGRRRDPGRRRRRHRLLGHRLGKQCQVRALGLQQRPQGGAQQRERRTTSVVRATLRCTPATSSTASATSGVISVDRTVARAAGVADGSSQPVAAAPSVARAAAPSALRRVSRGRGRGDTRRSY